MAMAKSSSFASDSLNHGVSVILATWKSVPTLQEAINSVLKQTLKAELVELIIVVNGENKDYFDLLDSKYCGEDRVKLVYTEKAGLGHARNVGARCATKTHVTFLDDDDWFTEGYLEEMLTLAAQNVAIVFGRLCDVESGEICENTYINSGLKKQAEKLSEDYLSAATLFGNCTCKLIRTSILVDDFGPIPEDLAHTEDVVFWAENFGKLRGKLAFVNSSSDEAYMRRILKHSMSRPTDSRLMEYIHDKLDVLKSLSEIVLNDETTLSHKQFVLSQISPQSHHLKRYCDLDQTGEGYDVVRRRLKSDEGLLVNRALFAKSEGIAFCQLFAPEADPSAYVATRRLEQIANYLDDSIAWNVFKQDYSKKRNCDNVYDMIYAQHFYGTKTEVNIKKIKKFEWWGQRAFERALFTKARYMYSRAQMPGSHVAAYKYKELYPEVIWFAEFSDPLSTAADGSQRHNRHQIIEEMVYEKADKIVFTNENQLEVMLKDSTLGDAEKESVRTRALVWMHPQIDQAFVGAMPVVYKLDSNMINIAFFGSFYKNRCHDTMLRLLKNPQVVLHIFTPDYFTSNYGEIGNDVKRLGVDSARLKTNDSIGFLEMLSVAQRMDYLFLNDVMYPGKINPYLPSKFVDYLATGTKIIALVQQDSILSGIDDERLIKSDNLPEEFIQLLEKQ